MQGRTFCKKFSPAPLSKTFVKRFLEGKCGNPFLKKAVPSLLRYPKFSGRASPLQKFRPLPLLPLPVSATGGGHARPLRKNFPAQKRAFVLSCAPYNCEPREHHNVVPTAQLITVCASKHHHSKLFKKAPCRNERRDAFSCLIDILTILLL